MEKNDIIKVKTNYINLKRSKKDLEQNLETLKKNYQKDKAFHNGQLKNRRLEMLNDKELRDSQGFSNQKAWEAEINKQTYPDEQKIDELLQDREDEIKGMEENLKNLTLDIESLRWDMVIELTYVKTEEMVI